MFVATRSDTANLQLHRKGMTFVWLRRTVVAVVGSTILLVGIAMIALPGPAVLVIPLGLAILATEFLWARRLLERARATLSGNKGMKEPK
jgi:uncharacterized protein (TIGR02611 family)